MDSTQRIDAVAKFVMRSHWQTIDLLYESRLSSRVIICPMCGHASGRDGYQTFAAVCQFGGGQLERYQCPDCDFIFGPLKILDLSDAMLAADCELLYQTYQESNNLELGRSTRARQTRTAFT